MEANERQVIDDLFLKLRQAEQQSVPRDPDAERHIAETLARQPAAPYYMSQVILVQEQALAALNQRVQELEREVAERPAAGGGFLGGLFGAPAKPAPSQRPAAPATPAPAGRGWSGAPAPAAGFGAAGGGGGGFLAGAAQTALGVAGGVMLASALTGLFASDPAAAAEPPPAAEPEPEPEPDPMAGMDEPMDEGFGDFEDF